MIDRYTKIVLTVIAIGLWANLMQPWMSPGKARAAEMGCGATRNHPCFVEGWGPEGTLPIVNDSKYPLKVLISNGSGQAVPVLIANPPHPLGRPY